MPSTRSALGSLVDPTAAITLGQVRQLIAEGYDIATISAFRGQRDAIKAREMHLTATQESRA